MTLGANVDPVSVDAVTERHNEKPAAAGFDGIAIALGGVALVALAWSVRSVINPFIAAFVLYVMLSRFRQYRSARSLMTTGFALFGLWLLIELAGILVPFILGAVLAYVFNPLVSQLYSKRRISRTWSSLTIVILFTGALVAIGWILIPSLGQQTKAFIGQLTIFIRENANTLDEPHLRQMLINLGLPAGLVDHTILTQAAPELRRLVAVVPTIVMKMIAGLPRLLERTLNLIIVPIAMFYFLKDWPKLMPIINGLFPSKNLARRTEILADVDRVLYGYVRGQATVAVLMGILGAIAYSILGIPYAGLLGVILAVSDLVPIVGMIFSAFIVELVIFLTMQLNFAIVASGVLVIVGLHLLEVYIIGPRIIGQGIGI
ncbi:MAG TPA: AI-2E family transporter, partial [Candidatus Kapabacteria bacterium]|nr:AI-2E family transporter [Candidatus Kapabacteria bacterium]